MVCIDSGLRCNTVAATSNAKEMMASISLVSLGAQAVAQLTEGNRENQTAFLGAGAIQPLVAMLGSPDARLQATAAAALSGLSRGHAENQAAGTCDTRQQ